jgi:hypothetical protein
MVYALSKVCLDETAKTYWSCKDLMCEQETKPEQFNHDELIWIRFFLMQVDRTRFEPAPYTIDTLNKLQDKLDTMTEMKS